MTMRKILTPVLALVALLFTSTVWADSLNINAQTGTTYTVKNTDCSKYLTFKNVATTTVTLPQASGPTGTGAANGLFMPPCSIILQNIGYGNVVIVPTTSTIGGAAEVTLATNGSGLATIQIVSDGTNYQVPYGIVYASTY
jgi:hypothetical protein